MQQRVYLGKGIILKQVDNKVIYWIIPNYQKWIQEIHTICLLVLADQLKRKNKMIRDQTIQENQAKVSLNQPKSRSLA